MLTQEFLKSVLHYCPETGQFTWLVSPMNRIKIGQRAGCFDKGYVRIWVNKKLYLAHRLAWLYVHGEFPNGDLDHINRNPSDNSIANLRIATRSQNIMNCKTRKDSLPEGRGIQKVGKRWNARIGFNKQRVSLGWFDTAEDASNAYKLKAIELYGQYVNHDLF